MNYILFVNIIEEFWWFTLKEENQKFNWKKNLIETKELSFYQKLKLSNPFIFTIWWCKPLIFQTYIIWSNRIHCLKYQRSKTLGSKDIEIRKIRRVYYKNSVRFKDCEIFALFWNACCQNGKKGIESLEQNQIFKPQYF